MPKHYEVEYTVHGEYTDTIFNADNKQHVMDQIMSDLENQTGEGFAFKDVTTFTSITEVERDDSYPSGAKEKENNG